MIGGRIIEIAELPNTDRVRLWCVDRNGDEAAVFVERAADMPALGQEIWWQAGVVYFDRERKQLRKIGNSFDPRGV